MARHRPTIVLVLLSLLALAAMAAFMTVGAKGQWSFVLPFRGIRLAALLLVAYAVAVSTVLFQTITNNRILTPSIMGFDALYILIQTVVVFAFGSAHLASLGPNVLFVVEVAVMVAFSALLYRWLLSGDVRGLHLLLLVGVIFGALFRSLSNLMQRMIDPLDFAVLQDRFFASFNTVHSEILGMAGLAVVAVSVAGWRLFRTFDVLALGRENAINLGLEHRRLISVVLVLVTILVSVSTALVGPVTFFGLLVANLAYQLAGSPRHGVVLPVAILLAVICLVGGQIVLQHLFAFDTALSVVIEFLGGITFILLLLSRTRR
ncbi:MAG: iron chelate uptake ABC transporter family permease subunit [Rhizobiales bacterium]|nr:iron chelate uptake ABC transporter family permease subunit [Hyphomicrobiales bacterium]MBN9323488.1 iron chelate uptake ABC transporter family permease subunit [Delftia acidovorans]